MIDVYYNLSRVKFNDTDEPVKRYLTLLPIEHTEKIVKNQLSLTPLIKIPCLAKRFGLKNVFLKAECENPTRSTKDKMAAIALSVLAAEGKHDITMSSTGNSSTAFATLVADPPQFTACIFSGKNWLNRLNYRDSDNIRTFCFDSSYDELDKYVYYYSENNSLHIEGGFLSASCREGLKLAYLEAYDQANGEIDYVYQAISSGMGLLAAYKAASEFVQLGYMKSMPAFIGAQQSTCDPMVKAASDNSDTITDRHRIKNPTGIAKAILRGDPTLSYPYLRQVTASTGGQFCSVSNDEIHEAKYLIEQETGLSICFNSAIAVAAFMRMSKNKQLCPRSNVLINLSGGDRKNYPSPQNIEYIADSNMNTPDFHRIAPLSDINTKDLAWIRCKNTCYSAFNQ